MEVKAPVFVDSLDKPNAGKQYPSASQKPRDFTGIVVGAMSIIAVLLVLLFIWVIRSLQQGAYEGSQFDYAMLTLLKVAPVIALTVGLICSTLFGVQWLRGWAIQKFLVSVQSGPHYRADEVTLRGYGDVFYGLAEKTYEVANRRADKSIYAGVQTLTVDQSTSTNTTAMEGNKDDLNAIAALSLADAADD